MRKRLKGMAAMVAVVGLLGSACSEGNNDSGAPATDPSSTEESDTETTGASEAPTTEAPVVELAVLSSSIDTGLAYTGGPGGVASGEPIKIGYVNQEGGVPSFPDTSVGVDSGVWFVNNFLGGVGGRPIELVKCFVVDETDSQKCAQEMLANDEVQAVLVGAMASANLPLLETLKDKKPVFIPNPLTPEEFFATDAYAFTPGGPGVIQGMAVFTAKYLPEYENREVKKVAVLYSENAAGVVAFEVLTKPILERFGIEITAVPLPDTAGPTEMASAIQSSGADTADVLYPIVTVQGCIGIYDALATLEITIPVVTTGLCSGVPMQDHVKAKGAPGSLPDGWYFGDYGYAYEIPGNPDNDTYIDAALAWARETGVENPEYTGFGRPTFGSLLTLVKFMNDGALDASALRAAAKAFTGPMWAGVGEFKCGGNAAFPSLCGFSIGIQQQQGDTLVSIMDGYNGKSLNPIAELAAG